MLFVQLLRGRVRQQRVERRDVAVPRGLVQSLAVVFSISTASAAVAIAVCPLQCSDLRVSDGREVCRTAGRALRDDGLATITISQAQQTPITR